MAQVTYKGPGLSLSVKGRKRAAVRGKPFSCSDPKELEFYRSHPDFSVVEPRKKKAAAEPQAAAAEPAIPPARRRKAARAARSTGGTDEA